MKIYLVQHATATETINGEKSIDQNGKTQTKRIVSHALSHYDIEISNLFYSNKLRAKQTAEILKNFLSPEAFEEVDNLNPMDNPAIWHEKIENLTKNTMLIGHLPHLSKLASVLLCSDYAQDILTFKNSCIICLEKTNDNNWLIDWVLK